MTGIWAPDCDCDAMTEIAWRPVKVVRFETDREALAHYSKLTPDQIGQQAVHGPSGHLLAVR